MSYPPGQPPPSVPGPPEDPYSAYDPTRPDSAPPLPPHYPAQSPAGLPSHLPAPYQPYPPGPYPPYPPYPPPPQVVIVNPPIRPTSGLAVTSLVFGIIGIVLGCYTFAIPNLLAVVFGHLGLSATRDGLMDGRGMAVAGLVMGYVMAVPVAVILIFLGGIGAILDGVYPLPTATPTPTPTP